MSLIDQVRENRQQTYTEAHALAQRAAGENRPFTQHEQDQFERLNAELDAFDSQLRNLGGTESRATLTSNKFASLGGGGGPTSLSPQDAEIARAFRSAIYAKNPAPIEVGTEMRDEWPADMPEAVSSVGRVRVHRRPTETRDTLKTTATQALRTDVYDRIVEHMVETSSLMAAGATVVTTATGETLAVPKSTGFVSTAIIGEGASITESDPTLGVVNLGAFKFANYFEISRELADDTPTNLLDFLARQAAASLGLGATGFGDDIINGTGTGQPRGLLLDAAAGVTGPAGTGTSLGTQGTADQGTDALWNLVASLAEPYTQTPTAAFLLRNASDVIVRKLQDTTGQPVQGLTERGRILGYPSFVDPFMPAMADTAESIAFGDMSRYFLRIVNGVRFERSFDYKFQEDLVAFRCVIRLDGALIDTSAVKTFVNNTA